MKNKRTFFTNKVCHICGQPAHIFKIAQNKRFLLCEKKKCSYIADKKTGMFSDNVFNKLLKGEKNA